MDYLSTFFRNLLNLAASDADPMSGDYQWTTHDANRTLYRSLSIITPQKPALPDELILLILDHPSRWIRSQKIYMAGDSDDSQSPNALVHVSSMSGQPSLKVIVSTKPLSALEATHIRSMVFNFRSRDQGWSSFRSDHGTYRNCWSWFEAGVRWDEEQPTTSDGSSGESGYTYERHELQRNKHAGRHAENYRVELDHRHPLLSGLQEGSIVDLLACAVFPGWQNLVYAADIEVFTFDDLRDDVIESR